MNSSIKTSIGEINVICTDLEQSLIFYRDVLGFTSLEREGVGWHMSCGGVRFLLLAVAQERQKRSAYCQHPEFSLDIIVEDLEEAYQHMKKISIEFVSEFEPNLDRFFIRDPDGLVIEVIQHK